MCLTIVRQVGHNAPHISITLYSRVKKACQKYNTMPKMPIPDDAKVTGPNIAQSTLCPKGSVGTGRISLISFFKKQECILIQIIFFFNLNKTHSILKIQ